MTTSVSITNPCQQQPMNVLNWPHTCLSYGDIFLRFWTTLSSQNLRAYRGAEMTACGMPRSQTHLTNRWAGVLLILLAVAVFWWGLQAKLSLYICSSRTHSTSEVKLAPGKQHSFQVTGQQSSPSRTNPILHASVKQELIFHREGSFARNFPLDWRPTLSVPYPNNSQSASRPPPSLI